MTYEPDYRSMEIERSEKEGDLLDSNENLRSLEPLVDRFFPGYIAEEEKQYLK